MRTTEHIEKLYIAQREEQKKSKEKLYITYQFKNNTDMKDHIEFNVFHHFKFDCKQATGDTNNKNEDQW